MNNKKTTHNDFEEYPKYDDNELDAALRRKMLAGYGRNSRISGEYNLKLSAKCHNGTFVGIKEKNVIAFKGIPYAKPPVKNLRWKPPVMADTDDGIYEAFYFGHSPIQTPWPSEEASYYPNSENCLTLNVWTSAEEEISKGNKAVMVFFHGGSYGWGGTSDPIYNGCNLINDNPDIVLVTVGYRIGIMGFIDFSDVPGGEDYKYSGNLGLLDHVCALKWIHTNIQAFGGDKHNITIFGESAGGGTVSLLPVMQSATGLFNKVIAESGSVALTYSKKECKPLTQKLLKLSGCCDMDDLMALSEEKLAEINMTLNDFNNFPERDGIVIPSDPYKYYEKGMTKDITFMIGTNSDETRYWIREMSYSSNAFIGNLAFRLGIPVMFHNNLKIIEKTDHQYAYDFFEKLSGRKLWRIVEFYNDLLFRVPAVKEACEHSKNGGKSYMYFWKYPSSHKNLGACHAVELSYVFNNLDVTCYTGDNVDKKLAGEVQQMWTNFARCGDPSTANVKWEPYSENNRNTAILDKEIHFEKDPLGSRRKALEPLLKYYINGNCNDLSFSVVPVGYKIAAIVLGIIVIIPTLAALTGRYLYKFFRKIFKK